MFRTVVKLETFPSLLFFLPIDACPLFPQYSILDFAEISKIFVADNTSQHHDQIIRNKQGCFEVICNYYLCAICQIKFVGSLSSIRMIVKC